MKPWPHSNCCTEIALALKRPFPNTDTCESSLPSIAAPHRRDRRHTARCCGSCSTWPSPGARPSPGQGRTCVRQCFDITTAYASRLVLLESRAHLMTTLAPNLPNTTVLSTLTNPPLLASASRNPGGPSPNSHISFLGFQPTGL